MLTENDDINIFSAETPILSSHEIDESLDRHLEEWEKDNFDPPKTLYYYTNIDTFYKIIDSNNFWATHLEYLNDKSELSYAFNLLKKIAKDLRNKYTDNNSIFFLNRIIEEQYDSSELFNLFVICFSGCRDRLSQWRGYGAKNKSICIGLDTTSFDIPAINELAFKTPLKIIYNAEIHTERITKYLDDYLQFLSTRYSHAQFNKNYDTLKRIADLFKMLLIRMKDPAWYEEEEWRLVYFDEKKCYDQFDQPIEDESIPGLYKTEKENNFFRISEKTLIPYLKRNPFGGKTKIKLKEVIIPQTEFQNVSKKAIECFLSQQGYDIHNDIKVCISAIPIRY